MQSHISNIRKTTLWCRKNISGFPKKGTLRQIKKLPNVFDVVIRKYVWLPEKKKDSEETPELVGKLVGDKYFPIDEYRRIYQRGAKLRPIPKDMIPSGSKYEDIEDEVRKGLCHQALGTTPIFVETAKKIGLIEDLKKANFDISTIQTAISVACHWLSVNNNSMRQYQDWAIGRHLPFSESLTTKALCCFAIDLGRMNDKINNFFEIRRDRYKDNNILFTDSTRISTTAENVLEKRKGKSKKKTIEEQVGNVLIVGQKSNQPLLMRMFAGDVPDVSTINDLVNRINEYQKNGIQTKLVCDKGYNSEKNEVLMLTSNKDYLMSCKTNLKYVQRAFVEVEQQIMSPENLLDIRDGFSIYGKTIKQEFEHENQTYTHYVHVYLNSKEQTLKMGKFYARLQNFRNTYKPGNEIGNDQKELLQFFDIIEIEGKKQWKVNDDKVQKETRFYGYFADVSSWQLNASQAYRIYKDRQLIENCFKAAKQNINFGTARGHSSDSLNGRNFIAFIAISIIMEIMRSLEEKQCNCAGENEQKDLVKIDSKNDEKSDSSDDDKNKYTNKKTKKAAKTKQFKGSPVFYPDIVNGTKSIGLEISNKSNRFWLTEITKRQRELAYLAGVPDAYDNFRPYNQQGL